MIKFGVDVSRWQGDFNFSKAKSENVEFAIIKAGGADGGLYRDSKFERNYKEAKANNIAVGAYFFGRELTVNEAEKAANYFIELLKGKQFEYPVYYDVEGAMLSLSADTLNQIIDRFCTIVQNAGYFVGIYASASQFKSKIKDKKFTHWVALWTKSIPTGIDYTDLWQFGGETNFIRTNKVAGVTCDQDFCYRDFTSEIKSKGLNGFNKSESSDVLFDVKVLSDYLFIRKLPDAIEECVDNIRDHGIYSIVELSADEEWGKLSDGRGWIYLGLTKRV